MSEPSFSLSKRGATWWATFPVGKRTVKVECGDGSRKAAEKLAAQQQKKRLQLYNAAKQRWVKHPEHRAGGSRPQASGAGPGGPPAPPLEELEGDLEVTPIERPPAPAPPPPPPRPDPPSELPAAAAPDPNRAAEIKAKLLALGDGRPIEPDSVHGPGEEPDEDDPPMDNEAGELLADVIAGAAVTWHVKKVTTILKKAKPPRRPEEPNEKMLEWERAGLSYNIAKLVGKATTMGPTAKMFVGFGLVTVGMLVGSEVIDGASAAATSAPAAAAPPAPAPATAAASPDVDDSPPPTPIRPNGQTNALGKFK